MKSAHKRISIRPSEHSWLLLERGSLFLPGLPVRGYVFCSLVVSSWRTILLRLCHQLIYISHSGQLYVDDFIFSQSAKILPVTACLLFLFFQSLNVPLSWKKCELSHSINWIGWRFNFTFGIITIPSDKMTKLRKLISQMTDHKRIPLKVLQRFVGLAMWITQIYPHMRIWLHDFTWLCTASLLHTSVWTPVIGRTFSVA